jgi:hypothetical protein
MLNVATTAVSPPMAQVASRRPSLVGRCLVNPVVDYLFVGGAITVPIFILTYFFPQLTPTNADITMRIFIVFNGAHFAASTVRLYTKPGAQKEFPLLSWAFPVLCLAAVGLGLWSPFIGRNITALYFTWSPYHYAMQTYGLVVMYAMKSGAKLESRDKTQMWLVCLLPFVYAVLTTPQGGIFWFVSRQWLATVPALWLLYRGTVTIVSAATLLLPVSLFWQLHRMRGKNVPLISLVLQLTNAMWWLGTTYLNAWFWTAMLHSIQYLIVVVERHVSEQMARPNRHGPLHRPVFYAAGFYGVSFVLAVIMFFGMPLIYVPFGYTATQSFTLMAWVINLHHFIVDGFIWRTKPAAKKPALSRPLESEPIAV